MSSTNDEIRFHYSLVCHGCIAGTMTHHNCGLRCHECNKYIQNEDNAVSVLTHYIFDPYSLRRIYVCSDCFIKIPNNTILEIVRK